MVARTAVVDDGVTFDVGSIEAGPIREGEEYGGVRLQVTARIATAVVRLQVDVDFGDAITPGTREVEFTALLDFPAPRLRAGFVRKAGAKDAGDLASTMAVVARFGGEPLEAAASGEAWRGQWPASGPWEQWGRPPRQPFG